MARHVNTAPHWLSIVSSFWKGKDGEGISSKGSSLPRAKRHGKGANDLQMTSDSDQRPECLCSHKAPLYWMFIHFSRPTQLETIMSQHVLPISFVFMHDKSASNMYAYLFIYIYIYICIQQTLATMFIYTGLHGFTFSIQRLVVSLAWFVTGKPFGLKFHPNSQVSTPVCLPQAGPCISWHKWI